MGTADERKKEKADAREMYAASLNAGTEMSVAEMVDRTGRSERWCKTRRAEVKAQG
jgi:hypothetical protein